ncbi:Hypothetical predicted protein [Lecanosticta acicola]|uniref:Uncharacterized protein n=1 Tax=Lecanosticta acicola TaxID=111012 RepID=A0AAI8W0G3_9PEZI|nr:Hypothetical predicted protein [Lecanosticta acicola]
MQAAPSNAYAMDYILHEITPSFFISQSVKLNKLLNTVVQESTTASDPEAGIDYLQLTEILSSLLEESQIYSSMSAVELQQRSAQARLLITRLRSIELAITGRKARVSPMAGSRKRSRTPDDEDESQQQQACRLRVELETEQAEDGMPVFEGPFAEMAPTTEYRHRDQCAWWMEPYYD